VAEEWRRGGGRKRERLSADLHAEPLAVHSPPATNPPPPPRRRTATTEPFSRPTGEEDHGILPKGWLGGGRR